jgi:hypothetical protein
MDGATRTSGKAVAAFLAAELSVVCGVMVLVSTSDLFLLGIVLFAVLAFLLGVWSWVEILRASHPLGGKGLAGLGMTIPLVGLILGFLLLPAT